MYNKNIKAIAFDFGGVLVRENDYPLSEIAQILEKSWGNIAPINNNEEYYSWAVKFTGLPKNELEKITKEIVENIYELRDPDIFQYISGFKFAIASNHLSAVHSWLDISKVKNKFDYILISSDIGVGKPKKEFFEKLALGLNEKAENILFIDDEIENIEAAGKLGFLVLHYDNSKDLREEILKYVKINQ